MTTERDLLWDVLTSGRLKGHELADRIRAHLASEPGDELATKLRELAESQTELDPEARRVLYSRMRELYLR